MQSETKPSFTWPLAPSKPQVRTPITAKPIGKPPLAPLPRVPRASVPPPMVAEPVRVESVRVEPVHHEPEPVPATPAWIEPVRIVAPEPETETEPDYVAEPAYMPEPLDSMATFGAGILQARRGPNKLFIFAVLLAVAAIGALVLLR